ncbi:MAG: polyprenyl synthetase family protein [Oscillospiraceae bacterium]|nr:polyprenyl synthetase family protein [Oscillospiraceae bacterium]MBQ3048575.1 polyprenyl synthetase family protein [Oscillospiraceae bacterium]
MSFKEMFDQYRVEIEEALDKSIVVDDKDYAGLVEAMRYSLLSGGKRIRAVMVLEFCRLFSGEYKKAMPYACAIEMVHAYSLIHDDLPCMDDDDFRRGKPSCHKQFGEANALLAGDALLTHAFEHPLSNCDGLDAKTAIAAMRELAVFAGYSGMVGGQYIDLDSEGKKIPLELLNKLQLLKTSGLIRAAGKMGAILGGATQKQLETVDSYCQKLGLAFQITDDILDVVGDEKLLGKPIHSDEENEKSTYVSIFGLEEAKKIADELSDQAVAELNKLPGDKEFVIELTNMLARRTY